MKSVISLFIFFLLTTSHLMAERTKKKSWTHQTSPKIKIKPIQMKVTQF